MNGRKIVSIEVYPLLFPMKKVFYTAKGMVGNPDQGAPHVYVSLTDESGRTGWGEARPSPRWSDETQESIYYTVKNYFRHLLVGEEPIHIHRIYGKMDREIAPRLGKGQPLAKSAVEMALLDLLGKQLALSVSTLLFSPAPKQVPLSYLISSRDPEEVAAEAAKAKEAGFKGIDLKIGFDVKRDLELVEAASTHGKGLFFRVDANQGYTFPEARKMVRELGRFEVDLLEQPLPATEIEAIGEIRRTATIPIALDESIWSVSDLVRATRAAALDAVVIKVTKMGGVLKAKEIGEIAKAHHLQLIGGGLTESRLGFVASAILFHALEIKTPVDLNGPFFLKEDATRDEAEIVQGEAMLPTGHGFGVEIHAEKLKAYINPEIR